MRSDLPEFDELNNIKTTLSEMLATDTSDTIENPRGYADRKHLEDTIFELITMGYVYGVEVAGLDFDQDFPVSRERMFESANRPTKGETFRERIEHHLDEYEASPKDEAATEKLVNQLAVVAETETHRTINEGGYEAAERYAEDHPGVTVYKTWETMQDDKVRDEHEELQGATVPLDARFYSWTGDSALRPGDFMSPELNINCRCLLRYTTR
mgnify:CR=1 FL=1